MASFRLLHSLLKVLSNNDLKGTRIEGGFERAFATLFDQGFQTFKATMLLNLDQLEKHLAKEEFQELESFNAFRVLLLQFQTFLYLRFSLDNDECLMISKRVNDRTMQSKEGNVASSKVLDAGLIVTECSGIKSDKQDTRRISRNYITHAVDADIRPVNDQVPFVEVQLTAQHNVLANEQQHSVQSEPIYDTYLMEKNETSNKAKIKKEIKVLETINIKLEHSVAKLLAKNEKLHKENEHNDSLIAQINSKTVENADLKAQIQEKVFANVALKNELRKLKGNSVDTNFSKPSISGKPVLQPPRNQSVVRQLNTFKSERPNFSKPQFAS
ncbi:hypothetical protein Tco_1061241 [Tanacetum coccineum]